MNAHTPFGEWLRQRRKLLDLTQAELATQVGVSTVTIRKIEAGDRRPSKELAELLAVALHVPEREHTAFVRFARTDRTAASLPLSAWSPDMPAWRSSQLPGDSPADEQPEPSDWTLHYKLFPDGEHEYQETPDGRQLVTVQARGPVSGDVEGRIEVQITQLITPKPPGYGYSMALPTPIGAHFLICSGEASLKGIYSGTLTPLLDTSGNGEARVRGTGRVYSASAAWVDCFLRFVFVEDRVKMIEGQGTGASGNMYLKP